MLDNGSVNIEDAIQENGEIITSTVGISMYPMLRNRKDTVVIERVNRPLRKYDVPLYRDKSGKLLLHRIIKVTENGYVIRGDNRYYKEYGVKESDIIGVLKAFWRKGKYYDCAKSVTYRIYVRLVCVSYPLRYIFKFKIRPVLSKIKKCLLKSVNKGNKGKNF